MTQPSTPSVLEQMRRPPGLAEIDKRPDLQAQFLEDVAATMQACGLIFHVTPESPAQQLELRPRYVGERISAVLSFTHGHGHFSNLVRLDFYDDRTRRQVYSIELSPLRDEFRWVYRRTNKSGARQADPLPDLPDACESAADARAILGILARYCAARTELATMDALLGEPAPRDGTIGSAPPQPRYDLL